MKRTVKTKTLVVVVTTVANEAAAQKLARAAIEKRLAACVQCLPIRSVYRWKGAIEQSQEVQLLLKTPGTRQAALLKWLAANHPYETPEIIVQPVSAVSAAYLAWAVAETDEEVRP